jgi:CheY-like chemotaxis protein
MTHRVLIIENDQDSAEVLSEWLTMSGFEVLIATGAEMGLKQAQLTIPDAIVCDIGLPDMDGFLFARTIREHPALASVRLIAISGYADQAAKDEAAAAGFERYIVKPAAPDDVEAILRGLRPDSGSEPL